MSPDNNGMILSIGLGVSGLVFLLLTTIIVVLFYLRKKAEQHKKRQQIENDEKKRLKLFKIDKHKHISKWKGGTYRYMYLLNF